ncbi:beta-arrestin-2-like isoform X4 [Lampetra planeri]
MEEKTRTRVFKKNSPNGKLTVYLGKRDFVDHLDHVDPVDGVVLVEPDYLKERKVFVALACVFRYGREDLDVLGLSFRKELFTRTAQVFPRDGGENGGSPPTRLQERLLRKLGENAHPFVFHIPQDLPCSVTLQPGPEDTGKACGVDYEVKAFCANSPDEKPHHRAAVRRHLSVQHGSVPVSRGGGRGRRDGGARCHAVPGVPPDSAPRQQPRQARPGARRTATPWRHQPRLLLHSEGGSKQGVAGDRRLVPCEGQGRGGTRGRKCLWKCLWSRIQGTSWSLTLMTMTLCLRTSLASAWWGTRKTATPARSRLVSSRTYTCVPRPSITCVS